MNAKPIKGFAFQVAKNTTGHLKKIQVQASKQ